MSWSMALLFHSPPKCSCYKPQRPVESREYFLRCFSSAHSFSFFSTDCANISEVERLSRKLSVNAVSVWVLAKTRLQHSVRERDSRLESLNIRVSVCTHHSSSILPALAWTSSLRRPSASLPISPADTTVQSNFLMLLHSAVVLRTDKPGTFVFCPQGILRYSMT